MSASVKAFGNDSCEIASAALGLPLRNDAPRSTRAQNGFTILEVLIATLLVGVGIFALMEAFNRGYFGRGEVEDYSLALSLVQEKMEDIQDSSFGTVSSSARAIISGFPDFERKVDVASVHADLKQVVVTTYWAVPNGENSVTLTTYAVNN